MLPQTTQCFTCLSAAAAAAAGGVDTMSIQPKYHSSYENTP